MDTLDYGGQGRSGELRVVSRETRLFEALTKALVQCGVEGLVHLGYGAGVHRSFMHGGGEAGHFVELSQST